MEIIINEIEKEGKNSSQKLEEENTTARGNFEAARVNKEQRNTVEEDMNTRNTLVTDREDKVVGESTTEQRGVRQRACTPPRSQTPKRKLSPVAPTLTGRQRKLTTSMVGSLELRGRRELTNMDADDREGTAPDLITGIGLLVPRESDTAQAPDEMKPLVR